MIDGVSWPCFNGEHDLCELGEECACSHHATADLPADGPAPTPTTRELATNEPCTLHLADERTGPVREAAELASGPTGQR